MTMFPVFSTECLVSSIVFFFNFRALIEIFKDLQFIEVVLMMWAVEKITNLKGSTGKKR